MFMVTSSVVINESSSIETKGSFKKNVSMAESIAVRSPSFTFSPCFLRGSLGAATELLDRMRMDDVSLPEKLLLGTVCVRGTCDNTGVGGSLPVGLGAGQNTDEAKSSYVVGSLWFLTILSMQFSRSS